MIAFAKAAWLVLKGIPWWVFAAAALLLFAAWQIEAYGDRRDVAGAARVQAQWDAAELQHARARAESTIAARVLEQRHRDEMKAIADRFLAEQEKADEDHAAAVAAVRAGTVRVRDRFTCPSPGVPAASADPGSPDDAGPRGLQPADLEYLLGIGAEADAVARRLNALQDACRIR